MQTHAVPCMLHATHMNGDLGTEFIDDQDMEERTFPLGMYPLLSRQ